MDNYNILKRLLSEKVKDTDMIVPTATLKDLKIDSLDLVDVICNAEVELGITFDDDELLGLKTVQDVLDLMDQKK